MEWSSTIQIQGAFLGIMLAPPAMHDLEEVAGESRLVIWNWHTGILFVHMLWEGLESFAFLDDHTIMFAHIRSESQNGHPALTITNFCTPDQEPMLDQVARNHITFLYPALHSNNRVYEMRIRTDPAPYWSTLR